MILPVRRILASGLAASLLGLAWLYPQAAPPQKKPAPQPQETRPTFKVQSNLVLVDCTVRDRKGDLIREVTTAEGFVTKKATPHDLIAIATYSSTLQLVQDLTNDREVLLDTLKHMNPTEAGNATEDDLGDPDTSDDTFVPDDVQFNIFNTDRRLSALETVAKAYREFPERKSLIYFSSGMTTTGVENQSQIRSTVDVANQSNMSIYTVDSRGLQALPPGGGASRGGAGGRAMFTGDALARQTSSLSSSQETLTTLAHDTGGTAFQDTND